MTLILESCVESTDNYTDPSNALVISVHNNISIAMSVPIKSIPPQDYLEYWLSYNLGNRLIILSVNIIIMHSYVARLDMIILLT